MAAMVAMVGMTVEVAGNQSMVAVGVSGRGVMEGVMEGMAVGAGGAMLIHAVAVMERRNRMRVVIFFLVFILIHFT